MELQNFEVKGDFGDNLTQFLHFKDTKIFNNLLKFQT